MICSRSGFIRAGACGAAAALAAAIMVSCSDKSTEPEPPVAKTLKIAFISTRDGSSEIYVMNTDGTEQKRLTNNVGEDGPFSWSPDGSKICFVSEQPGFAGIYVMEADGTHQKLLTQIRDNEETKPVWSPDGRKIVFSAYAETSYEIQVMNADGTNLANLTHSPSNDFDPAWSPDGSKIAFVTQDSLPGGGSMNEVRIMNADGTGSYSSDWCNCSSGATNCVAFSNPLWSPRDTVIVFEVSRIENPGLTWIFSTRHRELTPFGSRSFQPVWSPDGSKLAFVSDRNGANEIYVMEADGSNQTRLANSAGGIVGAMWPAWLPDSSKIVYASDETGDFEIYIRELTATRLTHTAGQDMLPACAMSAY